MNKSLFSIVITSMLLMMIGPMTADAATVGYWRMEQDTDGGAGFSIPNEIGGGNALTGASGSIEALNGGGLSFFPNLPDGTPNSFGLNGTPNINGTVNQYPALDVTSGTFEFFGRTNEGDARMLLRQTGATGLRVDSPNNLRVQYSTGAGQVTLQGGTNNFDANWDHAAFTYDEVSGVGRVFVNGSLVAFNDGADNQPLTWPNTSLQIGNGMDGGGGFSGNTDAFLDEVRISNTVLQPHEFLNGSGVAPTKPGILFVTNNQGNAQPTIDFLQDRGHTVSVGNFNGAAPTQAFLDANDIQLVIVARESNSGDYNQGTEPQDWNALEVPMINMNMFLYRNNRWGWQDGNGLPGQGTQTDFDPFADPNNPLLVGLDTNVFDVGQGITGVGNLVPGTEILATFNGGNPAYFIIPAGTTLFNGRGITGDLRVGLNFGNENDFQFVSSNGQELFARLIDTLAPSAVPEPTTATLGLIGLAGLLVRRRRAA